ncbi:hypothetical protein PM082_018266 [Marasmius tenuissimus]|nr:hypothetical protein PM082_018266 [Marasmius tenuissimus]
MQLSSVFTTLAVLAAAAGTVMGERHTVNMINRCGRGTPQLIRGPKVLSTGGSYTENNPLTSAIAYLQTGQCLFNGENCMTAELTLKNANPSQPGSGSSVNLSLIPIHAFNVPIALKYPARAPTAWLVSTPTAPPRTHSVSLLTLMLSVRARTTM